MALPSNARMRRGGSLSGVKDKAVSCISSSRNEARIGDSQAVKEDQVHSRPTPLLAYHEIRE